MRLIVAAVLFASAASAQTAEQRVFTFAHLASQQSIQEFVNSTRSLGEIRTVSADAAARTVTVTGTPDQLAFTQWLLDRIDQSAGPRSFEVRETSVAAPRNETVVKVFYPVHIATPQSLQETVNAVRSIGEIPFVTVFSAAPAILIRTTAAGAAFAEWTIRNFDEAAAGSSDRSTRENRFEEPLLPVEHRREAVRIYYPSTIRSPLQLQETINVLRSILEIQRIVAFTQVSGIMLRGNDQQAAAADWLVRQLDQPVAGASPSIPLGDQTVRTFFVPKNRTAQNTADTVNMLRRSTGMQRVVSYQGRNAIVVRGTAEQVANAESFLK